MPQKMYQTNPIEWFKDIEETNLTGFTRRDFACLVLPNLDYDAQLNAIRRMLRRNREDERFLSSEIKQIEQVAKTTSGLRNERASEELIDRIHSSIYQDAAHSMAAVGMIAPLVESIFFQVFQGVCNHFEETKKKPISHDRWGMPASVQWDCHYILKSGQHKKNLIEGIFQLADAVELSKYLPSDLQQTLQALFEYRNKMFHLGFEWPINERSRFQKRIKDAGWPSGWFSQATSGDKPWIFYLTANFIDQCMNKIDYTITGIGDFCRKLLST